MHHKRFRQEDQCKLWRFLYNYWQNNNQHMIQLLHSNNRNYKWPLILKTVSRVDGLVSQIPWLPLMKPQVASPACWRRNNSGAAVIDGRISCWRPSLWAVSVGEAGMNILAKLICGEQIRSDERRRVTNAIRIESGGCRLEVKKTCLSCQN